jgi:hypothetical protein
MRIDGRAGRRLRGVDGERGSPKAAIDAAMERADRLLPRQVYSDRSEFSGTQDPPERVYRRGSTGGIPESIHSLQGCPGFRKRSLVGGP